MVTEDIFIRTVRPRRSVKCELFLTTPNRNFLTYFELDYWNQFNIFVQSTQIYCMWLSMLTITITINKTPEKFEILP